MTSQINFEDIDLDKVKAELERVQSSSTLKEQEIAELQQEIAAITAKWQTLSKKKTALEEAAKNDRSELRSLQETKARAERINLVKQEQERLSRDFAEKAAELDELTKNSVWRTGIETVDHHGNTVILKALDHQVVGGKHFAISKRGILGDKRGLGKTITGLVWGDMVGARRILVLAPNDVVPQFEDEIRTWAPHRTIFSLRGMSQSQRALVYPLLNVVEDFIITLNFEAWRKDKTIVDDLIKAGIDTLIVDEAHRIKTSDKVTARGVFQIAYRPNYCPTCKVYDNFLGPWKPKLGVKSEQTDFYCSPRFTHTCGTTLENTVQNVLSMTGTPILNKPQELFSLLFLVNKEQFPSESKFLRDYCFSYAPGKWTWGTGGLAKLTKFISKFYLQRTREDAGIHIPPPAITVHALDKDVFKYAKQYEAERMITEKAQLLLQDGTRKDIFFILEMILRERQVMTWPAGITIRDPDTKEIICKFDVEESQKLDAACELAAELLEEGERFIFFSQFVGPLREAERRMKALGYSVTMATGDQSNFHKQQVREDFDLKTAPKEPRWQGAFATFKAFGTGVNLNGARHMIILDDEWNPGMEDQAIGRIDRMNSEDQANVHIFRVNNSIDDWMASLLEQKLKITDGFNVHVGIAELMNFFK